MNEIPAYILCAVAGYLLGSISTGILLTRRTGTDIRKKGSKNTGASNVLRVLGPKLGILTFVGDFLKAAIAVCIGWILVEGAFGGMLAAVFAVIGHNYPVFFGFRGGKGVACSTAVMLMLFPWQGAAAIAVCILLILITRYISAGSISMFIVFFFLILFTRSFWPEAVWALFLAFSGIIRHSSNIKRLLHGTEHRIFEAKDV